MKTRIPWNKGLKGIHLSAKSEFKKGEIREEKHPQWKGEKASYSAKHLWIRRWYGQPKRCDECGVKDAKKYEWANISKDYRRDISDWKRLCVSCHQRMDGSRYKQWQTRRALQCVSI